jgi:YggT family protein
MAVLYVAVSGVLQVLFWTVLVNALLSWVPALTRGGGPLAGVERATAAVVNPLLGPIRDRLPGAATVDFSPLVLMLLLQVAQYVAGALLAR